MLIDKTSALALAALLAAGVADAQQAQTEEVEPDAQAEAAQPAEGEAEVIVVQGDDAEAEPAEDGEMMEAQTEDPEVVEGGAEVVVEEAEPVEAEVVTEEVEAEPVVVEEAEPVVVEEAEPVVVEEVEVAREEVPEGQPVEGQIFTQSAEEVLGSTFLDASVMSAGGDTIGDVEDVIMSADGQVSGVVIGVGGFLGIGEKRVAVEFGQIQIMQDEVGEIAFVLDATEEELEAAPEFRTRRDVEAEEAAAGGVAVDGSVTDPVAVPGEGETVVVPSE